MSCREGPHLCNFSVANTFVQRGVGHVRFGIDASIPQLAGDLGSVLLEWRGNRKDDDLARGYPEGP